MDGSTGIGLAHLAQLGWRHVRHILHLRLDIRHALHISHIIGRWLHDAYCYILRRLDDLDLVRILAHLIQQPIRWFFYTIFFLVYRLHGADWERTRLDVILLWWPKRLC